jgi:hypothetical protein
LGTAQTYGVIQHHQTVEDEDDDEDEDENERDEHE